MLAMSFLRHDELVGRQAIEGQQATTAQLLVHRVMPVAHGGLRHLGDQGLRVAQQSQLQSAIAVELVLEPLTDEPVRVAGALHDRPAWRGLAPMKSAMPITPSLPTTEISAEAPFSST